MESKNKFKKMNFKNRTCYYFDDITKVQALHVDNILLDKNNLVYNILYKESIDSNRFHIWFDKIDGVIKICNEVRYLEFSIILINSYNINYRIYNKIFDKTTYLISEKSDDKYCINHDFAIIRIDSYNPLPKEITFHNVINTH